MQDVSLEGINLRAKTKWKRNLTKEVYHVTMKMFSFISCLRTTAIVDAMNLDQGNESFHPPDFSKQLTDSRQGMYTTRQTTNRPYRNQNVRPLGGTLLLSVPVLDLLRPVSYITISGVLCNFFSSCVIFSDPFYPASSSCQRACFSLAAQRIQRQMSASSGIRKEVKGSSHDLTSYPVMLQLCARIYGRHGSHVTQYRYLLNNYHLHIRNGMQIR